MPTSVLVRPARRRYGSQSPHNSMYCVKNASGIHAGTIRRCHRAMLFLQNRQKTNGVVNRLRILCRSQATSTSEKYGSGALEGRPSDTSVVNQRRLPDTSRDGAGYVRTAMRSCLTISMATAHIIRPARQNTEALLHYVRVLPAGHARKNNGRDAATGRCIVG